MVYHWYGKYQDEVAKGETGWEADFRKAKFAALTADYLVRMVEALNGGGCYEFDLTIEDFAEWVQINTLVVGQTASNEDNGDDFSAEGDVTSEAVGAPTEEEIVIPNPFEDTKYYLKLESIIE